MDLLNIDFKSMLPYVVDAFTHVYGEEYRSIITERIHKAVISSYHDVEGLSDYVYRLKICKKRELSIRFFEKIGMDISREKRENYMEPLNENIVEILEYYIGPSYYVFSENAAFYNAPLQAFRSDNQSDKERLLENKLKLINYLRGNKKEKITKDNFESFVQTEEYQNILKEVNRCNIVYEELLQEYIEWEKQFCTYQQYIDDEEKRKKIILQKKKDEMFQEIFSKLPSAVREIVSNRTFHEQQDAILGNNDIASTMNIETFRQEKMKELQSSDTKLVSKFFIVFWQSKYLKDLGITISNEDMLRCNTEEDIIHYLEFLNQNDIKKYIPTEELIQYIKSVREKKYEEAMYEYYTTREDFKRILSHFENNPNNIKTIYYELKNKMVAILGAGGTNQKNGFVSLMFYTVRVNDAGFLSHCFLHEFGHVIDQSSRGCGFEYMCDYGEDGEKNLYDVGVRKYEKFNETLNDIFTIEANKILQNQGIYLIEPKEFTLLDTNNCNTTLITKQLLYPLVEKFRKQVIKAKINVNREELIKYIGEENFEELVDAVNKVDYLSRNGVVSKIESSSDDEMVIEYYKQVEKVKQIYMNIDEYYQSHFDVPIEVGRKRR